MHTLLFCPPPYIVTNSMCPRQFYRIMWWEAVTFTETGHVTAVQDCPFGAVGESVNYNS